MSNGNQPQDGSARVPASTRYSAYFAPSTPRSQFDATIRLPSDFGLKAPEKVVRPALAVLFRIAVGPSADRYVRRFLAFERTGRGRPGWHWPSLLLPSVWAFYRRLWLPGLVFALLPIAGALAFAAFESNFERADYTWIACALLAVWILPGVLPALCADALLYVRVRRVIRGAERSSKGVADAVQKMAEDSPTSPWAGVCLGGGALIAMVVVLFPQFRVAYDDLGIRAQVAQTLAAVRFLEQDIEAGWAGTRLMPKQSAQVTQRAQSGAALIDEVNVNPATGRVRLALGPSVPELSGKTILLAPSRDLQDRVQWVCVPIDIPQRYLPKECRG